MVRGFRNRTLRHRRLSNKRERRRAKELIHSAVVQEQLYQDKVSEELAKLAYEMDEEEDRRCYEEQFRHEEEMLAAGVDDSDSLLDDWGGMGDDDFDEDDLDEIWDDPDFDGDADKDPALLQLEGAVGLVDERGNLLGVGLLVSIPSARQSAVSLEPAVCPACGAALPEPLGIGEICEECFYEEDCDNPATYDVERGRQISARYKAAFPKEAKNARYPFLRTLVIQISSTFRNAFSRILQVAF